MSTNCLIKLPGLLLLLTIYRFKLQAQTDNNTNTQQLWVEYAPVFKANEKMQFSSNTGIRMLFEDKLGERFHITPYLRYKTKTKWAFDGAFQLIYAKYNQQFKRLEIRPWQGVRLNWPNIKRLSTTHTLRLEERLSYLVDNDWQSNFDLRLRYRLTTRYNFRPNKTGGIWSIPAYIELFIPANDVRNEFFHNRNREALGIGYTPSDEWSYDLLLLRQKSRSGPNDKFHIASYAFQLKIKTSWNFSD